MDRLVAGESVQPAWYDDEARALEARISSIPPGALLLYGSSSIRLWEDPQRSFPGVPVFNHGFGGATLAECVDCFDRLVRPVHPGALLLYAGDNDIADGATGEQVLAQFQRFARRMEEVLPTTPWAVVSIKPSPSRRHLLTEIRLANRLIATQTRALRNCAFIDVFKEMADEREQPPFRYFTDDWLHMNREGYELWTRLIRPWFRQISSAIQPKDPYPPAKAI